MDVILTREELKKAIFEGQIDLENIYHDITKGDRFIIGIDADDWQNEGAEYDHLFGGDWMPLGLMGIYKIVEEAFHGTYCGEPV